MRRILIPLHSRFFLKLSETDRINTALASHLIDSADIAFYQGLGFIELGEGYEVDALHSFRIAIKLDTTGEYRERAMNCIAALSTEKKYKKQ